jgi:hypothetical protein
MTTNQAAPTVWTAGNGKQLANEPNLVSRVHALRTLHQKLAECSHPELPPGLRDELGELVARAEEALRHVPRIPTAYDAVWRALHEARHLLCEHGDTYQKLLAVAEIRTDIEYHQDKAQLEKRINAIIERMCRLGPHEDHSSISRELVVLSTIAAEEREAAWRKTNRTIGRLKKTSVWLWFGTFFLIVALPWPLTANHEGLKADMWQHGVGGYALVALCGAVGGLLSGMFNSPRSQVSSLDHHFEMFKVKVRPCVGAISALILRLVVIAGAINIPNPKGISAELLLLAIAAGFSERIVISQIERVAKASGAAGPTPTTT